MTTHSLPFRLVLLLLIPALPLTAGCDSAAGLPTSAASVQNGHEDDDHDHDHPGDHHIAAHRPNSFADLVRQLQLRPAAIRAEADHDLQHAGHELEVLHDIIRWLPEIAADTDLTQQDWDTASGISCELATIVPTTPEDFIKALQPGSQAASRYGQCVAQLEELIPRAELD